MPGLVSTETKRAHGGKREGAGRKKRGNWKDPKHTKRPPLSSKHPVHVSMRTHRGIPRLRDRRVYQAIRRVLARYLAGADFRVVHISIQHNHLHLIAEASGKRELTHGMQSFAINAARAINRAFDRRGKVFEFRYSAKQIKTQSYARNALSYVLNNWRRHNEDFDNGRASTAILDEFSSAVSFTGWAGNMKFKPPPWYEPLPVSEPQTALMQHGWEWFGLIDPTERPGPIWK